jgi:aspartyl-tRNA(Asn)/glutamyl-tRNA(Gln) amidotransferase subunit C
MKLDEATLDRIAELARLDVSDPARRAQLLQDMQRVFDFVEKLNEVDTTGVEPLIFLNEEEDVLRDDVVDPAAIISKKDALMNSPVKDSDYFEVPKVVDKS